MPQKPAKQITPPSLAELNTAVSQLLSIAASYEKDPPIYPNGYKPEDTGTICAARHRLLKGKAISKEQQKALIAIKETFEKVQSLHALLKNDFNQYRHAFISRSLCGIYKLLKKEDIDQVEFERQVRNSCELFLDHPLTSGQMKMITPSSTEIKEMRSPYDLAIDKSAELLGHSPSTQHNRRRRKRLPLTTSLWENNSPRSIHRDSLLRFFLENNLDIPKPVINKVLALLSTEAPLPKPKLPMMNLEENPYDRFRSEYEEE